jgi:hypothetical protein
MTSKKNALLYFGPREPHAPHMEERQRWIREVAYYKAMHRCFTPGQELGDWLAAEKEVDGLCRCLLEN